MMDFDSHLSNAPSTCTQHGKGHLLESDRITDIGNFVELSIQEATQSVIILIFQVCVHEFIEIVDTDLGIKDIFVFADLLVEFFFTVIFVLNITYDFFDQVLNSYQTSDRAILIDDNNHMHTLLLYLAQEIIKLFGLRNKVSRAYQVPNRESIVALA